MVGLSTTLDETLKNKNGTLSKRKYNLAKSTILKHSVGEFNTNTHSRRRFETNQSERRKLVK